MSSGDIWYFLKGQETVGPFSKEILQQIHEGGQLTPETLVWKEGMENWLPAAQVSELEIPKKAAPPAPAAATAATPAAAPAAPAGGLPKLKLKSDAPPAAASPASPEAKAPASSAAPASLSLKPIAPVQPAAPSHAKEHSEKEEAPKKASPLTKLFAKIFSSLIIAPLFLIVAGVMMFLYQNQIPNVFWVVMLAIGFGGFGVISLVGVRGLDGLFRLLSLLFLLPPLFLFWPVIMREAELSTLSPSHWIFAVFCLLYMVTIRIGLRDFIPSGLDKFACATGIMVLGFIAAVGNNFWTPPGWDELIVRGREIKLPGAVARIISKPEWGTEAGSLNLKLGKQETRHGIESITLGRSNPAELSFRTLDNIRFAAKISFPSNTPETDKILNQEWPVFFYKDEFGKIDESDENHTLVIDGEKVKVISATLMIQKINKRQWEGTLNFNLTPQDDKAPTVMTGSFKSEVKSL
jgi:hypothetical protein